MSAPAAHSLRLHRWRWLPPEATSDAAVLLTARGARAFADGFVSVLLPVYLLGLGFDGFQIGAVATATLVGSAALTLLVGRVAHRFRARPLLASAASPLLSGYLLGLSTFGWPLVIGGVLKAVYDLLLLAMFARVRPPEERSTRT